MSTCPICLELSYFCPPDLIEGRTPVASLRNRSRVYACDCPTGMRRPIAQHRRWGKEQCHSCHGVGLFYIEFVMVNERHQPTMVEGTRYDDETKTSEPHAFPLWYPVSITCPCPHGYALLSKQRGGAEARA